MTNHVMAAIDGSKFSEGVCDYAAWASLALGSPLTFLHVVDNHSQHAETNLTGNIGLGSREHLLQELADLDEQRAKVAQEQGRIMLAAARDRAIADGVPEPATRQRNGTLVETLSELESEMQLLVLGKRGESAHQASDHLGSNLERVVRTLHKPILMVPDTYKAPTRVLIAFDGSKTMRQGIELLAQSALLSGVTCHVLLVGNESDDTRSQLDWALSTLRASDIEAEGAIRQGEVEPTLHAYQDEHGMDLLAMGAYGHSRIRHLLVGSTTTAMLRQAEIPILLLR